MISRVADHCFWFGRYLERAESTARVLQVTSALALDAELTPLQCWQPVIITAGEQERFDKLCGAEAGGDGERVQEYLTWNEEVPVCLVRSVAGARENARSAREVISLEAFESINELHLWLQSPAARAEYIEHRYGFYRRVRRDTQLALGLLRGTMMQDTPLYFIWLGVLLERVGQTARILDVNYHAFSSAGQGQQVNQVVEVALWLSLLRACYGFESYMKTHRGSVTGQSVASFLIFEQRFPRAVRHCLRRARETLLQIRPPYTLLPQPRAVERLRALETWLDARTAGPLDAAAVHEILTEVVDETSAAANEIAAELLGAQPLAPGPLSAPPPAPSLPPPSPTQSQSQSLNPGASQTQSG